MFASSRVIAASLPAAVAMLFVAGRGTAAQNAQYGIVVGGGTATDVRGVRSRAVTVAPTLTLTPDPRLALSLGATATHFENAQWSLAGRGAATARVGLLPHVALAAGAEAAATQTSYRTSFRTLDALPALELRLGTFTAFAGAHGALASTSLPSMGALAGSGLPIAGGLPDQGGTQTTTTRRALGLVGGASAVVVNPDGETLVLGAREEHTAIDQLRLVDRTASMSVARGRLSLSGALGARTGEAAGARSIFGSGAVGVLLPGAVSLELGAGQYPASPLTGTPAGRFASVGLSLRFGARGSAIAAVERLPQPAGIDAPAPGTTRLAIRAADAKRVEVAGDWNHWTPVAATRAANGVWYVDLRLPAGRYRYAFRVDGSTWTVPDGAAAVDDDFGGKSAWITVNG